MAEGNTTEITQVYCTQCGGAMRVAREHLRTTVECPHCGSPVEPWHVTGNGGPAPTPEGPNPESPNPGSQNPGGWNPGTPGPVPPPVPPHYPQADRHAPAGKPVYGYQPPAHGYQGPYSRKSKIAAGLLGIFLGGLGIHRFYLGFIGIGFVQLSLFLFLSCLGLVWIPAAWGFVEGILCFTGHMRDIDELPLHD